MRILLIAGGWSCEREVSLMGAEAIHRALRELGHEVIFFDLAKDLKELSKKAKEADFAFINLHGAPGEDGLIQAILDQVGCPYQGSGPGPSLIALNKVFTKILFENNNILTPTWEFVSIMPESDWDMKLKFPVVVKPNQGGSSVDIEIIEDKDNLIRAMKNILSKGDSVLMEEKIDGMEITCGVLGEKSLPPILIEPSSKSDFFDYYSKYTKGAAKEICPAPISRKLTKKIMEQALKCHKVLGLSGYSRTDFIVTKDERIFALETNTIPGMTNTSLLPQEAAEIGIDFKGLIEKLIDLGIRR